MKHVALLIIAIVSLLIINNLVRSIYNLWQKQELVGVTEQELAREKAIHETLAKQYVTINKDGYVEKEARNKLFFVKPGEQMVIMPRTTPVTEGNEMRESQKIKLAHWQEWLTLFSLRRED